MEDDHHENQRKSISVIAKVKEKAKKWRQSLTSKKKHVENEGNSTPSWGVSLADEDDDDHPHLPSPMYESEMGPQGSQFKSMKHPAQVPVTPSTKINNFKDVQASPLSKPDNIETVHVSSAPSPSQASTSHKPEAPTPNSGPAKVSLSPAMTSSHPSMPSATEGEVTAPTQPSIATKHNSTEDEGVLVKEYIAQKYEPGEDEKVLYKVISDAVSHENDDNVVEKVREAVTSLLGSEQSSPQPNCSAYHSAQCSLAQIPPAVEVTAEARTS